MALYSKIKDSLTQEQVRVMKILFRIHYLSIGVHTLSMYKYERSIFDKIFDSFLYAVAVFWYLGRRV